MYWKVKIVLANCLNSQENENSEPKLIKVKSNPVIAEYKVKLVAYHELGFDSWITLNVPPSSFRTINPIYTARNLITVKMF